MAELWAAILSSILSGGALIGVAIIQRDGRRDRARIEERSARREKENRLSMKLAAATLELSDVTAIAVTGGHTNGNVEAARQQAKEAQKEYEEFLMEETARAVAKV